MRKAILLTAAAAFLAVPAVVQAQESTDNITASAWVPGYINILGDSDLAFGELDFVAGETPATPGRFKIDHNQGYTVEFTGDQSLRQFDGTDFVEDGMEIAVAWRCMVVYGEGSDDAPSTLNDGANECAAGNGGSEHNLTWDASDGRKTSYFHIGGVIDGTDLTDHPVSEYRGMLTLSVKSED